MPMGGHGGGQECTPISIFPIKGEEVLLRFACVMKKRYGAWWRYSFEGDMITPRYLRDAMKTEHD